MSVKKPRARIGIYAGTFDPVHAGHVAFALQAMHHAKLDELYFLPERRPRRKQSVEHFAHRVAMLERAARPYPKIGVIELVDINFTVERTLPKLQQRFKDSQLVFLVGSDSVKWLPEWPNAERLLSATELVVGVRKGDNVADMKRTIAAWPQQPQALIIFKSYAADVSSRIVRDGLRQRQVPRGLLQSVARYSDRHWLYVSLAKVVATTRRP
jgi:nicotinate-nucleotide adenylyltransferase